MINHELGSFILMQDYADDFCCKEIFRDENNHQTLVERMSDYVIAKSLATLCQSSFTGVPAYSGNTYSEQLSE